MSWSRVRYAIDGDTVLAGFSPRHWGLGFKIERREFELILGPFFLVVSS